ncbi:protein translocase subunit SecD [Sanguibacter suaedae]|uniref:Protein translocase subunit SecD n=1 Tax=Sanguibacter suaedae TaxID=2795737 RepID=A0A934MA29_9MICO|nr:protein translocase subunit SecD [Sanguibacter suaedae]MBI9115318.1 protein translocase subunit SecD [Sanguibacter suaedae]
MATTNRKKSRPTRQLVGLGVVVVALFGSILAGNVWSTATWAPKLALDLEGGTQIILRPVTDNGEEVTTEDVNQAIAIIRQRVDSSGVAEAEITSQGGSNIVVALPGTPSEETLQLVRESAQMQFRPVLYFGGPAGTDLGEDPAADPTGEATEEEVPSAEAPAGEPPAEEPTVEPTAVPETAPTDEELDFDPFAPQQGSAENPSDFAQVTTELLEEFAALDCTDEANLSGGGSQPSDSAVIACADDGSVKYILGPVEISGTEIASADSGLRVNSQGVTLNEWAVNIEFDSAGTKKFTEVTTRLSQLPTYEQWIATPQPVQAPGMFAMVLDNLVISAPTSSVIIPDGKAEITGTFTRESATTLANQLNFGALPLTFEVQSESQVSATLGSEQLQKGLIAGVIGLVLVFVYSLVQYRALGFVTVASLSIAGILAYGFIALLSWLQGYRLSLPGVAGLIVAIGITADSFIVYFERIRDELRDGKSLATAVDTAWVRARRTILASDAVSLLAAVVLYFLAVGGVRGFAFTLGLTTVIDVLVVFLFTHPLMKLLARTRFFSSGHPASGLDPKTLGVESIRYAGRGRTSVPRAAGTAKGAAPSKVLVGAGGPGTDGRTMTIAERRAAQAREDAERDTAGTGASPDPSHETTAGTDGVAPSAGTDERKDGNH